MTDYGHDLQFGTFLTPDASDPEGLLELAAATEVAGLELVTFQDHPYQARFLDAWALIGTVLARTTTLRVAPNVTNLPLRPPFVLAKTVASLDVLSRGRVELGIGAGGFADAIAAVGGPRLSPGESIQALREGIEIIRGAWDVGTRSVRVEGDHYRVVGAHPGPAPAHDIEIWIGAIGPRMLALTGEIGDGWLPSMGYVPPDTLGERNAAIDAAAVSAGRDPAAIRRLYNVNPGGGQGRAGLVGPPADWPEQLAELTLTHGMSTFILAADDPALIQAFGQEVAPRTRDLVEAVRMAGPATPAPARPHITIDRPLVDPVGAGEADAGEAVLGTHDDGARRSNRSAFDELARPAYVNSLTPLEWTPRQRGGAQHLVDVHDHLRAELEQLHSIVDQVEGGVVDAQAARSLINTMTMRQNNWTLGVYCESYCRLVATHHTIEDVSLFPRLRHTEPGLGPVVERLEAEHHAIAGVLEEVDEALVALVDGSGDLDDLRAAMDLLDDTLKSHLAWEESMLLEPIARYGVL